MKIFWLLPAPTLTRLGKDGRAALQNLILARAAEKLARIPDHDKTEIAAQCVLEFAAEDIVKERGGWSALPASWGGSGQPCEKAVAI